MFRLNSKSGKVRLVTIVLIVIVLIVIEGIVIVNSKKNKANKSESPKENTSQSKKDDSSIETEEPEVVKAKAQIMRRYNFEELEDEVAEEFDIDENIIIQLSKNDEYKQYGISASDITVLEITAEHVKIARNAIRYDENGNEYTEELVEEIEYDKSFELLINSTQPGGNPATEARYSYYMRFEKK